jgi:hypothetical protein
MDESLPEMDESLPRLTIPCQHGGYIEDSRSCGGIQVFYGWDAIVVKVYEMFVRTLPPPRLSIHPDQSTIHDYISPEVCED